jgi:hypothetical protein
MANVRHHDIAERLLELAYNTPSARLMFPLRDFARDVLAQGYPREQLLADFERVREELRENDEAREDVVMDVMDFLYDWGPSQTRL